MALRLNWTSLIDTELEASVSVLGRRSSGSFDLRGFSLNSTTFPEIGYNVEDQQKKYI